MCKKAELPEKQSVVRERERAAERRSARSLKSCLGKVTGSFYGVGAASDANQ